MQQSYKLLCMLVFSCAIATAWTVHVHTASRRDRIIRFAYLGPPLGPRHQSALFFKNAVEKASKGTLRVELYPGGQLGGDRDAIEGVQLGTIDMTVAGAGIFANFETQMGASSLPFQFNSFEEAWAFNDSDLNAQITDRLAKHNLQVVAHWDNGFRCLTNSLRPINKPSDLRGLKIRTPENPIILVTLSALGANPSPLPWSEVYMALLQGAFDGQENPLHIINVNHLDETQTHLAITNHVYESMPVVVNKTLWNQLATEDRALLQKAIRDSEIFNRKLVRKMTNDSLAELEERGMHVTYPNLEEFRSRISEERDQFRILIGAETFDLMYTQNDNLITPLLKDQ